MTLIEDQSYGIIPLRKNLEQWEVFLVLHLNGNFWSFPKGHKNHEEDSISAAKRELTEETGLIVDKLLQESAIEEKYLYTLKDDQIAKSVYYYPAMVSGKIDLSSPEVLDGRWIRVDDAFDQITYNEAKEVLRKTLPLLN